jgi:hypothetical protein
MKIQGIRLSTPDAPGYPDVVRILNSDTGDMEIWKSMRFGTNPNPTKVKTTLRWQDCYAQIVAQTYNWTAITTDEKPYLHLRLSFNGSEEIPTTNMNFNHDGLFYAVDVNIEKGWRTTWRGSAACQEIYPDDYEAFISHFKKGDSGIYELIDQTGLVS